MFRELDVLRNRPIPNQDEAKARKQGYRDWPIDKGCTLATEPCVDLQSPGIAGCNHYGHARNAPYYMSIPGSIDMLLVRAGVAHRLAQVNERLSPIGLELFVFDAWRPAAVQHYFAHQWFPEHLRGLHPDWPEERIKEEAAKYWAPGPATEAEVNPLSPPPHATGAAVDLTLRWKDGAHLEMGTIFDDVTERAHLGALETAGEEFSFSNEEARRNRRLLYWLLTDVGFAANPTEWWHFSWGDQMWAKLFSVEAAHYTCINPFE